jgi:hypothetical protein
MNIDKVHVSNLLGRGIYASVNPVTKRLHNFEVAGCNEVFANYLLAERFITNTTRKK